MTVAESFAGRLTTVAKGKTTSPYSAPGWDVAGVEYRGSTLYFLESVGAGPMDPRDMVGSLKAIDNRGAVRTVTGQLAQYDLDRNVDAAVQYGLSPADAAAHPECVAQLAAAGIPASYTGIALDGDGNLYVASLFGEGIYQVEADDQSVSLFHPAAMAVAVEISGSTMYATTGAFGNGTLISVPL